MIFYHSYQAIMIKYMSVDMKWLHNKKHLLLANNYQVTKEIIQILLKVSKYKSFDVNIKKNIFNLNAETKFIFIGIFRVISKNIAENDF